MSRLRCIATLARWVFVVSWLLVVGAGMTLLSAYAATPGAPADPPHRWPSASTIVRREGLPTVLVFAHPGCPCTRATLGEIELAMGDTDSARRRFATSTFLCRETGARYVHGRALHGLGADERLQPAGHADVRPGGQA